MSELRDLSEPNARRVTIKTGLTETGRLVFDIFSDGGMNIYGFDDAGRMVLDRTVNKYQARLFKDVVRARDAKCKYCEIAYYKDEGFEDHCSRDCFIEQIEWNAVDNYVRAMGYVYNG